MAVQIATKSEKHCHQISIFENFFFKLPRSVTKWFHYMYTVFRNAFASFYTMFSYYMKEKDRFLSLLSHLTMLQGKSRIQYLRIPLTTHYYPPIPRDYVCQLGLTSLMNNYDKFTSLKGKSNIFFRNNLHYTCTFHHFPNLILLLWFKNDIFQFYKFIE